MPELPDVEGFRRVVATHGEGQRITAVTVTDPQVLRGVTESRLRETITGQTFLEPERLGKWLIMPLSNDALVLLHFGMTGAIVHAQAEDPIHRHDRVTFAMGDHELRYRDMRKLRGLWLATDRQEAEELLADVGPDALDMGKREFLKIIGTRRQVKATLMDQSAVAGLGNLLTDEICWRARINPRRRGSDLTEPEREALFQAMRRVLRGAIPTGRVPPKHTWLTGRRDDPDPTCPRCGTHLRHTRVAGRGTYWCPRCQP
jgi:formamidopyrimidine-DNA glycosylase